MHVFNIGEAVRVADDWPEVRARCHVRTPAYVRGKKGVVISHLGTFPDPSALAFSRPAQHINLYHVCFAVRDLWADAENSPDVVRVEIYENWLVKSAAAHV